MVDGGDPLAYPADLGNADHQRLLRAMTAYHARQPWARAFLVFGSVGRGDWDGFSDLDLDVVISDDATLDPVAEATRLCAAIGETPALIAPRRADAAEVVLESLAQFSIRYHPLPATSPNILDSMRLLWGRISLDTIHEAGARNRISPDGAAVDVALALAVRALLISQIEFARGGMWSALRSLGEARDLLLDIYAEARGLPRPLPAFERDPDAAMRAALARLVPALTPGAIRAALLAGCDLLLGDAPRWLSSGRAALTPGERHALEALQSRLQGAQSPPRS